jgi:hypothetical protein
VIRAVVLIALVLAPLVDQPPRYRDGRGRVGREGGDDASDPNPLLEAFTSSGVGTTTACSTTAPTGTKGEAFTFSRASSATCTKTAAGGFATTGIADGDLVTLATDKVRMEYSLTGVLGPLIEPTASTDDLLRGEEICNAAWSDVGTPGCLSDQFAGPWGTTTMDSITDNAAGAVEGRSQAITTTSATVHAVACYVKGSGVSASISMVGAGSSTGDCTASVGSVAGSSKRIFCVSPAAYAGTLTGVTVTIAVGPSVTDQGTLYIESCDHFVGIVDGYLPSTIPTTSAAVTRAAEGTPSLPLAVAMGSIAAVAVTATTSHTPTTGTTLVMPPASGNPSILGRFSGGNFGCYQMTVGSDLAAGTWTTGTNRWACSTQRLAHLRGTTATGSASTVTATITSIGFGSTGGFGTAVPAIWTSLCADVGTYARCVP